MMNAKEFFKQNMIQKGVDGVNEYTTFRWDEVVELMEEYAKLPTPQVSDEEMRALSVVVDGLSDISAATGETENYLTELSSLRDKLTKK